MSRAELFRAVLVAACILLPVVPARAFEFEADPRLAEDVAVSVPDERIVTVSALENSRLYRWGPLELEKDDLRSLTLRFGGEPERTGGECPIDTACWLVDGHSGRYYLLVRETLGELTEFMVVDRKERLIPGLRCPSMSLPRGTPENPAGLRLGMTRDEVVRLLGDPLLERGNRLYYASTAERAAASSGGPDAPRADSLSAVVLRLERGRVVVLSVSRVTTL
ncbi:MAG TPA: hypothetical protein PKB11_15605 [Desulfovibrio sp.]|jgi:hypothetical protein|uniref:hypothetical protein n=1 Tax=Desulfovibrio TaxID=872 RepID=UPI002A439FC1|nr:hypothetical protein [Desulfovibrio sp.]MDY0308078.1 hypothetical protein [Desulfovibrionaceae bacterium]HMM40182.1 hypothetical protein [Desulfovibrio sp.]